MLAFIAHLRLSTVITKLHEQERSPYEYVFACLFILSFKERQKGVKKERESEKGKGGERENKTERERQREICACSLLNFTIN